MAVAEVVAAWRESRNNLLLAFAIHFVHMDKEIDCESEVYFRASSAMSQVLVETLREVQWPTSSLSNASTAQKAQYYVHAADETVRAVGFALDVGFFLLCVVHVEWREWVRRRTELELTGVRKLPLHPVV